MAVCFHCQKELSSFGPGIRVGFREECLHCHSDVHVCLNCERYDSKAYNECQEPQAERVLTKDRSNRCDHFSLSQNSSQKKLNEKDQLRKAAEALFQKRNNNG